MEDIDLPGPVILFDGVCNLCSTAVQFVIRHDKKEVFRFAPLQSAFGRSLMEKYGLPVNTFNSFILFEKGRIYQRSTAALMVARRLSGAWRFIYVFIMVPAFIRNIVYDIIARNRYKWFGRKSACWLPTAALKARFID